MDNVAIGRTGEELAIQSILDLGYRLLEKNYRAYPGEIDIIAKEKNVFVFIEVKTRRTKRYGRPCEAVDCWKQRKIIKTAQCYLHQTAQRDVDCRFDIIEIYLGNKAATTIVNHIKNAFTN